MKIVPINIGKLNKRITFLRTEWVADEMGQEVPEWMPYKTVWATVNPVSGREYYEAQKVRPELTYKIYTRYQQEIAPDMQIKYKEKMFEIKSIINVEESNKMLEIQCIERIEKEENGRFST